MNKILDSAVLVAVLTAILFSLSIANFNGYLSEIGLEVGFVLRNSYQILYNSLFVILLPILKFIAWGLGGGFLLLVFAYFYTSVIQSSLSLRKFIAHNRRMFRKIQFSRTEKGAYKLVAKFYPSFIIAFFLVWALAKAETAGVDKGAVLLQKL